MLNHKIKPLALFIASALIPISVQAQVNMHQAADQTFSIINSMKHRGDTNDGVIVEGDKRYIVHNSHRFELHDNNYPKFPTSFGSEASLKPYYDTFPFLDEKWDIVMNNDFGFYFIHDEFGSFEDDEKGCFIKYHPHQSFTPEQTLIFENTDCLASPELSELSLSSVFDKGATLNWKGHVLGNTYNIQLTEPKTKAHQVFHATEPEFFLPNLLPETAYQVTLQVCNTTDCLDLEPLNFTTEKEKVGFHDENEKRNHLEGDIAAHVSLMQSHSRTAPFGNEELGAPDPVINREAILLVTPEFNDINQLWVEVYQTGELITRQKMQAPSQQPKTDQYDVENRPTVIFDHHVWSFPLQWDWMKPGLSLKIFDNHGRTSLLPEQNIIFGGAPELVIQNIDIGMLTPPRDHNLMISNTAEHAVDYFQKIAVSKLVMAQYSPAYFEKVTMPNGNVYTERSVSDGGWHSGDMRENIGKALVSTGINNANVGITTTVGSSQAYNRRFNHISAHSNIGVYTDPKTDRTKTIIHGGSGGGGIVTLEDTIGNEWSHELGHNFGLGHYPKMASVHDKESGWGWDGVYKRFIGNIDWKGKADTINHGGEISTPYLDIFGFLRDAQAGGEGVKIGKVSRYTLEHPKQVRRSQAWLNNGFNQTPNGASHYVVWDQAQQNYVAAETDAPAPIETGVAVTTLLGIYDPTGVNPSQIYPVIHGNYGNVFDLPEAVNFEPVDGGILEGGWYAYQDLSQEERELDTWKTIIDNGTYKRLCQFNYTTTNGNNVNLVGHVDETNTCRSSQDMKWEIDGQAQTMQSEIGDYSLLYPIGRGEITYTPSQEIGEARLCLLAVLNDSTHNGAGFIKDNQCIQVAGIKHTNNKDWVYTVRNDFKIEQGQYVNHSVCRLDVVNNEGQTRSYDLTSTRLSANQSNKFHINIAQNALTRVTLSCEDTEGQHILDTLTPDQETAITAINDLPPATIIGQEYGYKVLDSKISGGWFDHSPEIVFENLSKREQKNITKIRVYDSYFPLCRFNTLIDGVEQTVFGYVEKQVTGDHQCIGGADITLISEGKEQPLRSALNTFQWLSQWDPAYVGEQVKAREGYPEKLCGLILTDYYGAGFVNEQNQCTQVSGVKWSNGKHWLFSSNHGYYSYK